MEEGKEGRGEGISTRALTFILAPLQSTQKRNTRQTKETHSSTPKNETGASNEEEKKSKQKKNITGQQQHPRSAKCPHALNDINNGNTNEKKNARRSNVTKTYTTDKKKTFYRYVHDEPIYAHPHAQQALKARERTEEAENEKRKAGIQMQRLRGGG